MQADSQVVLAVETVIGALPRPVGTKILIRNIVMQDGDVYAELALCDRRDDDSILTGDLHRMRLESLRLAVDGPLLLAAGNLLVTNGPVLIDAQFDPVVGAVAHDVQIDTAVGFNVAPVTVRLLVAEMLDPENPVKRFDGLLPLTQYFVRTRSVDRYGNEGAWGAPGNATTLAA